jgi:hypothetical protein
MILGRMENKGENWQMMVIFFRLVGRKTERKEYGVG